MSGTMRIATFAMVILLPLQGCSSAPRDFRPVLQAAPADAGAFETAFAKCREWIAQGRYSGSGRMASAGAGVAAGAATEVAGTTIAGTSTAGFGALTAMGATIVLAPVAILGGAWGVAKMKKGQEGARREDCHDRMSCGAGLRGRGLGESERPRRGWPDRCLTVHPQPAQPPKAVGLFTA